MTEGRKEEGVIATRRGFPVWEYNPSAADVRLHSKEKPVRLERGRNLMLINPPSGEILAEGTVGFFRREVVDDEKFMKVFMGQIDKMFELTKTGQRILKLIWDQLHDNKDKDKVELKPLTAKQYNMGISDRIFQKGVRELLEKKFIFMSPIDGVYYTNMAIFFNGNRIIAATEYIREGTQENLPLEQPQLALENK